MITLEQIIEKEKQIRQEDGDYGIKACKESIRLTLQYKKHETLYTTLERFVKRANEDIFFNTAMVLACWELINGIN